MWAEELRETAAEWNDAKPREIPNAHGRTPYVETAQSSGSADDCQYTIARSARRYTLSPTSPSPTPSSHEVGSEVVDDGAEGQAVAEGGRHVGHLHVPVAARDVLAPLEQALETGVSRHGSLALSHYCQHSISRRNLYGLQLSGS